MKILHICPPHQLDVPTLPWESQKSHFSAILFIYLRLFTLPQKKINSNCCAAALAVYLLLFSASYYLHSPSTVSGARYMRSACIFTDNRACCGLWQRLVATWTEFQHSVVYYATDQCRKRLEACIIAEGDSPVATHHDRFFSVSWMTTHEWLFSESPAFERTQQTLSQMKKFCNLQVSPVAFKVRWISGWQLVFFWDNVNNQKYVWIILLKMTFWDFPR